MEPRIGGYSGAYTSVPSSEIMWKIFARIKP